MPDLVKKDRDGESGMALILAIGFLAILSILGAVVMQTSTRDLKASGAQRPDQQVFNAVDRAIEYSMTRGMILSLPVNGEANLMTGIATGSITHADVIGTADSALTAGMVYDIGPNQMPTSAAELFGDDFGANYYQVEAKAQTPPTGTPIATTNANSSIVRLYKRDDDTIFRTSRGG
jgi:Tfp pilus assembly protein PilX